MMHWTNKVVCIIETYAYIIIIIFGSYKPLLHAECAALEGTIGAVAINLFV